MNALPLYASCRVLLVMQGVATRYIHITYRDGEATTYCNHLADNQVRPKCDTEDLFPALLFNPLCQTSKEFSIKPFSSFFSLIFNTHVHVPRV